MSTKFLLQFIDILHLAAIFILSYISDHLSIASLADIFLIYASNFWKCTQIWIYTKYNTHEVQSDSLKYFTFVSHNTFAQTIMWLQ